MVYSTNVPNLMCYRIKGYGFRAFFSRGNAPTPFFFRFRRDRQRKTTMAIEQRVDRTRQASILGEFRLSNIHLFFALTTNLKSPVVFSVIVKGQKISKQFMVSFYLRKNKRKTKKNIWGSVGNFFRPYFGRIIICSWDYLTFSDAMIYLLQDQKASRFVQKLP